MLVYDYCSTGVASEVLPAGSIFQPWEPLDHWRGEKVPITLGGQDSEFDWGATSAEGRFIQWDDFFSNRVAEEPHTDSSIDTEPPAEANADSKRSLPAV